MKVIQGRPIGSPSELRTTMFTGTAWADSVMASTDGTSIANVFFSPGARTYWHTHGFGQILQVKAGRGWICLHGQDPQPIREGDTVWIGPGEKHWHGAAADSYLLHTAISIGQIGWHGEVTDAHYPAMNVTAP